ncbi:ABC transporter ATP-binding protein [Dielma fastidiosa]|uniref:ABC transporter ATP-binding protein n=1 Tax=Dielma fastidiosa TaxID=1034346 RepID=A0A318KNB3_9FIRM|nr:ABC transporter ATP-binding protein [Dielma fastidiosa]MDY5169787.1 ABC transporter ATP-binding protein [Dielma fastidiosa]PXX77166.1 putative ABC transport system ATP-binding protein [Dielma fastidiosa]
MITLKNINKSYWIGENRLHVLKDVNLTVKQGDFVTILGASGSGKSTLMNIIGCMDNFDSGSYELDGLSITPDDEDRMAEIRNHKIGFIFQKYHLIPQYDVLQNVVMPLLIRGVDRKQAIERAYQAIEMVNLSERTDHLPNELSGGQQQRVAIARALITQPSLLLADEPTGALDSKTSEDILTLFKELNAKGNTIIQISHDVKVAQAGKRIVYIKDGVLSDTESD